MSGIYDETRIKENDDGHVLPLKQLHDQYAPLFKLQCQFIVDGG